MKDGQVIVSGEKTSAQSLASAINAQTVGEAFNGMTAEEVIDSMLNFCIEEYPEEERYTLRRYRNRLGEVLKHIATGEYRSSTYKPEMLP
jgi:hypothetical protein